MTMVVYGDYLQHYGIKGMRWGIRRRKDPSSAEPRKSFTERSREKALARIERRGGSKAKAVIVEVGKSTAFNVLTAVGAEVIRTQVKSAPAARALALGLDAAQNVMSARTVLASVAILQYEKNPQPRS